MFLFCALFVFCIFCALPLGFLWRSVAAVQVFQGLVGVLQGHRQLQNATTMQDQDAKNNKRQTHLEYEVYLLFEISNLWLSKVLIILLATKDVDETSANQF